MTPKTTIAAEALVNLSSIEFYLCGTQRSYLTKAIRSALTDAAAEDECWRVIDEAESLDRVSVGMVMGRVAEHMSSSGVAGFLPALQAACDWIKKEGEK